MLATEDRHALAQLCRRPKQEHRVSTSEMQEELRMHAELGAPTVGSVTRDIAHTAADSSDPDTATLHW
jgi:hypothetical protein